ncbi:hypothetical protein C7H84_13765 [Burkholderia sp. Nafp2/4-1b]|nr:hypothetical protein C7H84_13765 [Burkholderia sp. Nafp2/4-1b]
MPDAHSIHESGRIIRRAGAMKNRRLRQIIIAKSAVRQIVAGRFHAAKRWPQAGRRSAAGGIASAPPRCRCATTAASARDATRRARRHAISRAPLP